MSHCFGYYFKLKGLGQYRIANTMSEYKPKKVQPAVTYVPKQEEPPSEDSHEPTDTELNWITKEALIKEFTAESRERFDPRNLPTSPTMKGILMKYLRNEFLLLCKYEYKYRFLRLSDYSNIDVVRSAFKPLKLVNSPKLTAKYMSDSIVAFARATSYDDIHKVALAKPRR